AAADLPEPGEGRQTKCRARGSTRARRPPILLSLAKGAKPDFGRADQRAPRDFFVANRASR
ncbi:MAG: hypothetical protein L6R19_27270, partial [Alphaproteobacteria bacterium]|nr:hypothetical protein [Alphaproteobacteria bacterium]